MRMGRNGPLSGDRFQDRSKIFGLAKSNTWWDVDLSGVGMDMTASNDEQLLRDFRLTGDVAVLDVLLDRHIKTTRAMIYQMVLNHADADDLTQEVFLRAFRWIGTFREKSRFSTWLYRIALNTTHSFLARKASAPFESHVVPPEQMDRPGNSPDGRALGEELNSEVVSALESLSPKLRASVVLTAIQGIGAKEAAQVEGCTVPTLYWRVHEARKILRKRLDSYLRP